MQTRCTRNYAKQGENGPQAWLNRRPPTEPAMFQLFSAGLKISAKASSQRVRIGLQLGLRGIQSHPYTRRRRSNLWVTQSDCSSGSVASPRTHIKAQSAPTHIPSSLFFGHEPEQTDRWAFLRHNARGQVEPSRPPSSYVPAERNSPWRSPSDGSGTACDPGRSRWCRSPTGWSIRTLSWCWRCKGGSEEKKKHSGARSSARLYSTEYVTVTLTDRQRGRDRALLPLRCVSARRESLK